ncbi:MAG: hypothetical protein M3256_18275 [Actinomycetota bacterium]|nr:hypothetical protein [Actinomycetota bacterium]
MGVAPAALFELLGLRVMAAGFADVVADRESLAMMARPSAWVISLPLVSRST